MKLFDSNAGFLVKAGIKTAIVLILAGMVFYNALPDYYFYGDVLSEDAFGAESTVSTSETETVININTASSLTLQKLNGIGLVKARAIIEYREKNGAFSSVDELINVKGIGKATLDKIRNDITV